mgnify:CR=1 FL=1
MTKIQPEYTIAISNRTASRRLPRQRRAGADFHIVQADPASLLHLAHHIAIRVLNGRQLPWHCPRTDAVAPGGRCQPRRFVRAFVVVAITPAVKLLLHLCQVTKAMPVNEFRLEAVMKTLLLAVGLRVVRPAMTEPDARTYQPHFQHSQPALPAVAPGRAVVSTPFAEVLRDYWRLGEWRSIALPVNDDVFDVPRPADQDRQGDNARALTVCHVSHLGRNKRPEETIRAVARLVRADLAVGREPTRLLLVGGEAHEIEPLKELARAEGIEQTSTFTGRVPHEEIGGLMAASDVFVLASEVEAGGTVLAEAQALGLACVATPTWAGRFMVEPETGLVLPAEAQADDDALVAALTEALTQVTDSIRAGGYRPETIRARARRRFGEATFVKACRELYEQACGEITGSAGSTQ